MDAGRLWSGSEDLCDNKCIPLEKDIDDEGSYVTVEAEDMLETSGN